MRTVLCSLLVVGVVGMSGCATPQNNFASKVKAESEKHIDLSQQWEQGQKDVKKGDEFLADGRKAMAKGNSQIREGEKLMAQAREEAQKQRQSFQSMASSLTGTQNGKRAAALVDKLDDIADAWEDADDKYVDGKELIEDGNTNVAEGQSETEQGQALLTSGRSRMQQAESKYQQRTGQGLVEQMHLEEQPSNF
ncbi:hypothetical protein [Shewanella livingstonensis]|uniref:Lipoprotein n=1 Tax=Shewanella livingstonensis TaxID=150120 RepID=A0A3G8LU06_9GAMM|nr:hypothetical protein [Shewanella livingstonensis]AZG72382.1 hypothetical protein EGC82_06095 [Shewanella livingstonensis]